MLYLDIANSYKQLARRCLVVVSRGREIAFPGFHQEKLQCIDIDGPGEGVASYGCSSSLRFSCSVTGDLES